MYHQRIENALNLCEEHIRSLDPSEAKNKELETYLVSGLVLLIISEYEEYLESLFMRRAQRCGDQHAINFIQRSLSRTFRSPDLNKINETLSSFDRAYKEQFLNEIENSREHAAWDSMMKARHAVVHKKGTLNMTFRELTQTYAMTKSVIDNLEAVLTAP